MENGEYDFVRIPYWVRRTYPGCPWFLAEVVFAGARPLWINVLGYDDSFTWSDEYELGPEIERPE